MASPVFNQPSRTSNGTLQRRNLATLANPLISSDSLVKVGNGSFQITLIKADGTPVVVSVRIFGIKLDGLVKIGNGSLQIALLLTGVAPANVSEGEIGIKLVGPPL